MTTATRSNSVVINLNQRYKNWLVISRTGHNEKGEIMYLCRCICGVEKQVRKGNLGKVIGCGCSRKTAVTRPLFNIKLGDKFNDWIVVGEAEKPEGKKESHYLCQCVCGVRRLVRRGSLGVSRGCGCIRMRSGFMKPRKDLTNHQPAGKAVGETKKTRSTKAAIPKEESPRFKLEEALEAKRLARELREYNLDYEL